ncbi:MAG: hypothetical protein AAF573_03030 [Bacteroidota bacterium]
MIFPELNVEYHYDFNHIYRFNHGEKNLKRIDVKKYSNGMIQGSWVRGALYRDWLTPESVEKYRNENALEVKMGNDTIINSFPCFTIRYDLKDDDKYLLTKSSIDLYVEKDSYLPVGYFKQSYYNGEYGSSRFELVTYKINDPEIEETISTIFIP